jgi:hypothetical protein
VGSVLNEMNACNFLIKTTTHLYIQKDNTVLRFFHLHSLIGPPEKHSFITYGLFPAEKKSEIVRKLPCKTEL